MNRMKIIFAILFLGSFLSLQAQDKTPITVKTTWGLKTETNLSGFIISGTSEVSSKMKAGVSAGGFVNFEFTRHWVLQSELIFHHRTSAMDRQQLPGSYWFWGVEVPIYAIYQYKLPKENRIYIGMGPYGEFGFDAQLKRVDKKMDLYAKDGITELSAMKDSDVGFGILLGYEFACGIQLNAGYKLGVANILDNNSSSFTMLPQAVSLGIGYRFGK